MLVPPDGSNPFAGPPRANTLELPAPMEGNPRRKAKEDPLPQSDENVADLLIELAQSASPAVARDAAAILEQWSRGVRPKVRPRPEQPKRTPFPQPMPKAGQDTQVVDDSHYLPGPMHLVTETQQNPLQLQSNGAVGAQHGSQQNPLQPQSNGAVGAQHGSQRHSQWPTRDEEVKPQWPH